MNEKNFRHEIGQRIKKMRTNHNLTQAQLAESLNISVNFLSEIENGKKGLSQETICKICNFFDISADYLLMGKDETYSYQTIINIAESMTMEELDIVIEYLIALKKIRTLKT